MNHESLKIKLNAIAPLLDCINMLNACTLHIIRRDIDIEDKQFNNNHMNVENNTTKKIKATTTTTTKEMTKKVDTKIHPQL